MAGMRKAKGSITVETVFIFPIILFIIIAFMVFTMHLHDRMVINCVMNEACERFNQTVKQPTNYETGVICYGKMTDKSLLAKYTGDYGVELRDMETYVKEHLSSCMMLSTIMDVTAEKGINDVTVTVKARNRIPLAPLLSYLKDIQKCSYKVQGGIYNPSEYARAADVSLDVISQTGAYDKIQKMFNKIDNALK